MILLFLVIIGTEGVVKTFMSMGGVFICFCGQSQQSPCRLTRNVKPGPRSNTHTQAQSLVLKVSVPVFSTAEHLLVHYFN